MSKMSTNCKLYLICHKMSNVKKSNTLTMDEVHKKFNLTQWSSHIKYHTPQKLIKVICFKVPYPPPPKKKFKVIYHQVPYPQTYQTNLSSTTKICAPTKSKYFVVKYHTPQQIIKVICSKVPYLLKNIKLIYHQVPYTPKNIKIIHCKVKYPPPHKISKCKVPYLAKKFQSNSSRCTLLPKKFQSNLSICTLLPKTISN